MTNTWPNLCRNGNCIYSRPDARSSHASSGDAATVPHQLDALLLALNESQELRLTASKRGADCTGETVRMELRAEDRRQEVVASKTIWVVGSVGLWLRSLLKLQKLITVLRPRTRMLTLRGIAPGRYTYWMFGRMVRPGTGTKPYWSSNTYSEYLTTSAASQTRSACFASRPAAG